MSALPTMAAPDAVSRVEQIQAMIAALQGAPAGSSPAAAPAPVSAGGTTFAAALQASTTGGAAAPMTGQKTQYDGLIEAAARRNGVSPALLKGLIQQESNFDPNSCSGAGAVGLCQLMPGTAASLGVSNPRDPAQSIQGGARFLRQMLDQFGGDPVKALAAYNAGPGAVQRYGGVPPYAETQDYVRKVLGYARQYGYQSPTPTTP